MDFFFPAEDLERLPPEETRIESLQVVPYPDGRRIRVELKITPFQIRPQLELVVTDSQGHEVSTVSIVEPMMWNLELTMHLRGAASGPCSLEARLFYPDGPRAEPVSTDFKVPEPQ